MSIYILTGKLGQGKTLASVGRIRDYLLQGRRVATNLDLNLEALMPARWSGTVTRVPDYPTGEDLWNIGLGYEGPYDDSKAGLVVLDECARWLNSREWNSKGRRSLIDWALHARKLGWDLIIIVQDIDMLDKQVRGLLAEHVVVCHRLDRLRLFWLRLPRVHWATVYYGETPSKQTAFVVERWKYRGNDLFDAFDTRQVFGPQKYLFSYFKTVARPRGFGDLVAELARAGVFVAILATSRVLGRPPRQVAHSWGMLAGQASPARGGLVGVPYPTVRLPIGV